MNEDDVGFIGDGLNKVQVARVNARRVELLQSKLQRAEQNLHEVDEDFDEVPDLTLLFENKLL